MAKRSGTQAEKFERVEGDFYATTFEAAAPLFAVLPPRIKFSEPCAGKGDLIDHLTGQGHTCVSAFDINPRRSDIKYGDAISALDPVDLAEGKPDFIITNPPWKRNQDGTGPLHEMILKFPEYAPTWLLFDADWAFCKQAAPFLIRCHTILAIGRVSWFGGGSGMDNCAWYQFRREPKPEGPNFINKWAYLSK